MRGNTCQFTLSNSARALLFGAVVLSTVYSRSFAQGPHTNPIHPDPDAGYGDEIAFAVPGDDAGHITVPLPKPLSARQVAAIRDILFIQRSGKFAEAARRTTALGANPLVGDILADRYLNPAYHPTITELKGWLKSYAGLSDAAAIQERLIAVARPTVVARQSYPSPLPPHVTSVEDQADPDPLTHQFSRNALLDRTVFERTSRGVSGAASALHLIDKTPGMTELYSATLKTEIAQTLLSLGEATAAEDTARKVFDRSHGRFGKAAYIAGLAAWRQKKTKAALHYFSAATRAQETGAPVLSAAAYWASRAERHLDRKALAATWLHRAAATPGTFYGTLARRALGASESAVTGAAPNLPHASTAKPVLGEVDVEAVSSLPQGLRYFALLQIGEAGRAEALLRRLWPDIKNNPALCHSVALVAAASGHPDIAHQIITILAAREDQPGHVEPLPLPRLSPRHGFKMDPALVYAVTRVESNFDPRATSGSGAHGLMQIRPVTASFITNAASASTSDMAARLHNPAVNLEIGQLYLMYLARLATNSDEAVESGDLIHVLAGYNAGPSAISHWEHAAPDDALSDPLLFIETLPNQETRAYVQRTLSYLWRYAEKMDLPAPSLAHLSHAEWPLFADERELKAGHTVH